MLITPPVFLPMPSIANVRFLRTIQRLLLHLEESSRISELSAIATLCSQTLCRAHWHPASGRGTARGNAISVTGHRGSSILPWRLREITREDGIHRLHVIFEPFGKRGAEGLGNLGMPGGGTRAYRAHRLGHHVVLAKVATNWGKVACLHLRVFKREMGFAMSKQVIERSHHAFSRHAADSIESGDEIGVVPVNVDITGEQRGVECEHGATMGNCGSGEFHGVDGLSVASRCACAGGCASASGPACTNSSNRILGF